MGDVLNRGTKANPRWYCRYFDLDGKRKQRATRQPTKYLAQQFVAEVEARIRRGLIGIPDPEDERGQVLGELFGSWEKTLSNRSADDDKSRLKRHLRPYFDKMPIHAAEELAVVMKWIDHQRAEGKIADPTIRHSLNLLSRFFSWAVERGHAKLNPVRLIPTGRRPRQSPKADIPWLDDDAVVRRLMHALPEPFNLTFYLGNRSGMRPGETAGLRLSDLGFLDEGVIRVRFSYDGPLKEDKHGEGRAKWVPAPDDAAAVLGEWLESRRAKGAGPEDLVFVNANGSMLMKEQFGDAWERVAAEFVGARSEHKAKRHGRELDSHKPALTYYGATRHSFVSRNLSRGVSLDEVSAAVGHSSPVVTRRYYDHFIRRSFSGDIRSGLGFTKPRDSKLLSFGR